MNRRGLFQMIAGIAGLVGMGSTKLAADHAPVARRPHGQVLYAACSQCSRRVDFDDLWFLGLDSPMCTECVNRLYPRTAIDWFDQQYGRRIAGAKPIYVQARIHDADLPGHVMPDASDRWDVLRLPIIDETEI